MAIIRTVWTSKKPTDNPLEWVGHHGEIWYDNDTGKLRYSDGETPGGIPIFADSTSTYVLPAATATTLGGIKLGAGLVINSDGTVSSTAAAAGNIDGGGATTIYTGLEIIDGGGI